MKSYNIAIIGGGPAGAIAAALCARSGLKTVLVEKKQLPRVKSCAGGVTARSIKLLQDIDCLDPQWFERVVSGLMIHYPGTGKSVELNSKDPYLGTVRRADFDMALVKMAEKGGAEIRQSESFIEYHQKSSQHLIIKTDKSEFGANILIGADGFFSHVRKQMHHEMTGSILPVPMMFGTECDVPVDQIRDLSPDHCHLFFNIGRQINYGWAFPKKDRFNIGIVLDAGINGRTARTLQPVHRLQILLKIISDKNINEPVRGAPIPVFRKSRKPIIQKNNILLVGDAAGFADAWTGEGIYYGIKSAVLAHQVIRSVFSEKKEFDYLANYSNLCKRQIYGELNMSCRVSEMFKKFPAFYNYLQYPKVRKLFIPHTQGAISYRKAMFKAFIFITGYKLRGNHYE